MLYTMSAERQESSENESHLRKTESLFVGATDYGDIYFIFIGTSLLLESKSREFFFPLLSLIPSFTHVSLYFCPEMLEISPEYLSTHQHWRNFQGLHS